MSKSLTHIRDSGIGKSLVCSAGLGPRLSTAFLPSIFVLRKPVKHLGKVSLENGCPNILWAALFDRMRLCPLFSFPRPTNLQDPYFYNFICDLDTIAHEDNSKILTRMAVASQQIPDLGEAHLRILELITSALEKAICAEYEGKYAKSGKASIAPATRNPPAQQQIAPPLSPPSRQFLSRPNPPKNRNDESIARILKNTRPVIEIPWKPRPIPEPPRVYDSDDSESSLSSSSSSIYGAGLHKQRRSTPPSKPARDSQGQFVTGPQIYELDDSSGDDFEFDTQEFFPSLAEKKRRARARSRKDVGKHRATGPRPKQNNALKQGHTPIWQRVEKLTRERKSRDLVNWVNWDQRNEKLGNKHDASGNVSDLTSEKPELSQAAILEDTSNKRSIRAATVEATVEAIVDEVAYAGDLTRSRSLGAEASPQNTHQNPTFRRSVWSDYGDDGSCTPFLIRYVLTASSNSRDPRIWSS